jgi:hypothetical protein
MGKNTNELSKSNGFWGVTHVVGQIVTNISEEFSASIINVKP